MDGRAVAQRYSSALLSATTTAAQQPSGAPSPSSPLLFNSGAASLAALVSLMDLGQLQTSEPDGSPAAELGSDWSSPPLPGMSRRALLVKWQRSMEGGLPSPILLEVQLVPMVGDQIVMLIVAEIHNPAAGNTVGEIWTLPLRVPPNIASSGAGNDYPPTLEQLAAEYRPQIQSAGIFNNTSGVRERVVNQPSVPPQWANFSQNPPLSSQQHSSRPSHHGYGESDLAPGGAVPQGNPFDRRAAGGGMFFGPQSFRDQQFLAGSRLGRFDPIFPPGVGGQPQPYQFPGPGGEVFPGEPDHDHARPFFSNTGNPGLGLRRGGGGGGFNYGW